MLGEWPERSLEEVCQLIVDCPHSTPEWTDDGVVVLRNQYIRNGRLDLSDPSHTTEEGYQQRVRRAVPSPGDLVVTREAPMGEVCQIPEGLKCCLGQRMVLVRADEEIIDPSYLLYVIQSPYLQHQVSWNEGTGTTVSNIRIPSLKAFQIPLPSLAVQKGIANILSTLDEKIELNRQMNATLESMAQALFKSWFVDFDPVIDNVLKAGNPMPEPLKARAGRRRALGDQRKPLPEHIQSQFPSSFVFSEEVGWIPEGWNKVSLGDVCETITDGSHASPKSEESGFPMASVKDMNNWGIDLNRCRKISERDYELLVKNGCRPQKDDVLIAKDGSYLKHIFVVEKELDLVLLSSIAILRPNNKINSHFLSFTLKRKDVLARMKNYVSGAVLQRIILKDFRRFEILLPPAVLQEEWFRTVGASLHKCWANIAENQSLSGLRDTLLPRLLSGQVNIPAEKSRPA